jgi:hypothetical protein
MVPFYILRDSFFNHGACPYTWGSLVYYREFSLNFHTKKTRQNLWSFHWEILKIFTYKYHKDLGGYY